MPDRFMQKGTTRFFFVPSLAAQATPVDDEVNAGTEVTPEVADVTGFSFVNQKIDTPDMSSTFDTSIPGSDQPDDSSLMIYERKGAASNPILAALAKGTAGYMVIFPFGCAGDDPAAADKCDVWPVTIAGNNRAYNAGNEASKKNVQFNITGRPSVNVAVTS